MEGWKSLNASGVRRYTAGEFEEAERIFREALERSPHVPVLGYNLGMSLRAQGKDEGEALVAAYESLMTRSCPYFDGRLMRDKLEAVTLRGLDPRDFDAMLSLGFRRTGDKMSRNVCHECRDCVQMRIGLEAFRPSASQRRALRRNADLEALSGKPMVDDERVALYERYLRARHGWTEADYRCDLEENAWAWPGSIELSYRMEGRLVCVGILDRGQRALYSSLCYFEPSLAKRSLGILSLTAMGLWGAKEGYRWLYTGEYLDTKPNMRYKKDFGPRQDLLSGQWVDAV